MTAPRGTTGPQGAPGAPSGLSNGSVMRVGPLGLLHWRENGTTPHRNLIGLGGGSEGLFMRADQPGSASAWADGCLSSVITHTQPFCIEAAAALSTVVSVAAACSGVAGDEEVRQRSIAALGAAPHLIGWAGMQTAMLGAGSYSHNPSQFRRLTTIIHRFRGYFTYVCIIGRSR